MYKKLAIFAVFVAFLSMPALANAAEIHPEIVKRLRNLLDRHVEELEKNKRPAAFVNNPKPIIPHSKNEG